MRMNSDSMTCDNNKEFKYKLFSKECFKLCSFENRQTGLKCGLNIYLIQYIAKLNKRHYRLQNIYHVQYMNIKEKAVGFKKNMKKHGLIFH